MIWLHRYAKLVAASTILLIAAGGMVTSTGGFLTIILAVWTWRVDPRPWVRTLGFAPLGAVILQGLLGGMTVLLKLPPAVSIGHAGLAQLFFCITLSLAVFTSA